jgi:hypothetical protein
MPTEVLLHVAAVPEPDDSQSCARCGQLLHKPNAGAPPPWYPGQPVAASESGRWAVLHGSDRPPECATMAVTERIGH